MTITEFLEARISEDEETASLLAKGDAGHSPRTEVYTGTEWVTTPLTTDRLLAECKAKRALIAILTPGQEIWDGTRWAGPLDIMAAVYKDHPNYDPEWAR